MLYRFPHMLIGLATLLIMTLVFMPHGVAKADKRPGSKKLLATALDKTEAKTFKASNGTSLPYRIYMPTDAKAGKTYPLVMAFHGAGGRGNDNIGNVKGNHGFLVLVADEVENYPAIVIAPQCPSGNQWVDWPWKKGSYSINSVKVSNEMAAATELLLNSISTLPVDKSRVYVTGQSMGGFATWDIVMRNPKLFAAAVAVCGGGDPSQAKNIKDIPIWFTHGSKDKVVPTKASQDMDKALKAAGAKATYEELDGVSHFAWKPTWESDRLFKWMFAQRKP